MLTALRRARRRVQALQALMPDLGPRGALRYVVTRRLGAETVRVPVHGVEIRLRTAGPDLSVARTSLGAEFAPLARFVDREFDGLIVDAGGFIGTAALKLSAMFPRATIVSIEPSEANAALLAENIAGHANIELIQGALVPVSGSPVELRDRATGAWGFTIVEAPADRADAALLGPVATVSLADIVARHPGRPIGLLKLDIEGGEIPLFDAAPPELAAIPVIFVELHDRIAAGCTEAFHRFSEGRMIETFGGEKFASIAPPTSCAG